MANSKILTQEQEMKLRQPIDEYVGKIQKQIDDLRRGGTDRVIAFQNSVDVAKEIRLYRRRKRKPYIRVPRRNRKSKEGGSGKQRAWYIKTDLRMRKLYQSTLRQ